MSATNELAGEAAAYLDGAAWTAGPQAVYDRLAERAVDALGDVAGCRVLDAGAGTGGATRALLQRGAAVTAVDLSRSMLAELDVQTAGRVPTTVADIRDLPLPDASYDAAIAAYVINHLDDPVGGVAELRRVTRPGGAVVATTFGADDHPIKPAVDDVLARFGFVAPDWYVMIKTTRVPLISTEPALAEVGSDGGLVDVTVTLERVDLSDLPAAAAAAYRLGLAHVVPFVQGLDVATRVALTAEVVDTIRSLPPLQLPMLVLHGRTPG